MCQFCPRVFQINYIYYILINVFILFSKSDIVQELKKRRSFRRSIQHEHEAKKEEYFQIAVDCRFLSKVWFVI